MPFYSEEDFEQIATTVRVAVELDHQVKLDVIEFIRRLKHRGYIADYIRVPDIALPDAEAKYVGQDRKIFIRESIFRGAERSDEHCRFSIVHECSHAIFDHQFERKRSLLGRSAAPEMRVPSIRREEIQTDKLAAVLLAPFHRADFSLQTTAEELERRFGLSKSAARLRLEEMARVFRRRHQLLRPLPPGVVDFLVARRAEGHRVTSLPPVDLVALQVRQPAYTGDACPNPTCGQFTMIRKGTSLICDTCGAQTGDG